jgi:hypothetical protein
MTHFHCAPHHRPSGQQRANRCMRLRSGGSSGCGFSNVSNVSPAIIGANVEAPPASAANFGHGRGCRAARRAGLWLAPRIPDFLKIAVWSAAARRANNARSALPMIELSSASRPSRAPRFMDSVTRFTARCDSSRSKSARQISPDRGLRRSFAPVP